MLFGFDHLVVPVGALDQPHGQRWAPTGAFGPRQQAVELVAGVAEVGLQDDADRWPVAKLRLGQQLEEQLQRRLARVERLHVDVQMGVELAGGLKQRPQPQRGVADPATRSVGSDQRRERGDLDREVCAGQRSRGVALEHGALRIAGVGLGERR
jgi:hypothetical protein